jgi:hypothetical protein
MEKRDGRGVEALEECDRAAFRRGESWVMIVENGGGGVDSVHVISRVGQTVGQIVGRA